MAINTFLCPFEFNKLAFPTILLHFADMIKYRIPGEACPSGEACTC
jgi:hypothetical protein